jgi:hypothetical protein
MRFNVDSIHDESIRDQYMAPTLGILLMNIQNRIRVSKIGVTTHTQATQCQLSAHCAVKQNLILSH